MSSNKNSPDNSKILELHKEGLSATEISKQTRFCRQYISKFLKNELNFQYDWRKYTLDESVFEVVDTEEKAYWVGFLAADGCIADEQCKNSSYITIGLSTVDEVHLLKFMKFVKSDKPLYYVYGALAGNGTPCDSARVQISSKKMIMDLNKLGVTSRKTFTLEAPTSISKELIRHYWRGFSDGDGSIGISKGRYTQGFFKMAGTYKMCEEFIKFINSNVTPTILTPKISPHGSIFMIQYSGKISTQVVKLMYDNCSIVLDRKLIKAQELYSRYS